MENHEKPWFFLGFFDISGGWRCCTHLEATFDMRQKHIPKTHGKSMDLARFERLWRSLGAGWRRCLAMWESKSQQEAVLSDQSGSLEAKKGPQGSQHRNKEFQVSNNCSSQGHGEGKGRGKPLPRFPGIGVYSRFLHARRPAGLGGFCEIRNNHNSSARIFSK